MDTAKIRELAKFVLSGETQKKEIVRITGDNPDLTVDDAYQIQEELIRIKQEEGHQILGPKMGLTSQAKMKQMNVEEPIYGYLMDNMQINNGGTVSLGELIHPRAEVEIAFILGADLQGPGVTAADVITATDYVVPALEIIDSRYEKFKFTLIDVVADNASSARVVFGTKRTKPEELDLELVGAVLMINGELKALGAGAAVLGNPAQAVAMLANMLARKGEKLKAGQIILSGAITEAIELSVNDTVYAKLDGMGEAHFAVVK
jgi:2-oxo-3-hexenedioate decarboxylase